MQTKDEPPFPASPALQAGADRGNAEAGRPLSPEPAPARDAAEGRSDDASGGRPREIGGRDGPEPTRFGDWEKSGRCIDF